MPEYAWGEEFQRKLLAWYLREPKAALSIVEPGYFTSPIMVDICRLGREVFQSQQGAELSRPSLAALVKDYLGKRRRDVWPLYRRMVRQLFKENLDDRYVLRSKAMAFALDQKYRKALVDSEGDLNSGKFERIHRRFENLKTLGKGERDLGINYWQNLNRHRWDDDRRGIVGTHYLPKLDRAMGGGVGAGELAIILAGTKVGKSTLLARNAAGALWLGKNAAIATGELSKEKYRKRIDSMITGIAANDLLRSRSMRKSAKRRLKRAHWQMKGNLHIQQWPSGAATTEDISRWLDSVEEEQGYKIDVLFVDYIRVFKPTVNFTERRERIGQTTLDLRALAVERDIPVWSATQTNRGGLSKSRLGPEDIAEDVSQLFTLDFLVALCQSKDEAEKKPEEARIYLMYARDAATGTQVDVTLDRSRFIVSQKAQQADAKWRKHG